MKHEIGDLVKLRSGGPRMTVTGFLNAAHQPGGVQADTVWVSWFKADGLNDAPVHANFHEDALVKIDDETKPTVSLVA